MSNDEVSFIQQHLGLPGAEVMLRYSAAQLPFSLRHAAMQIEARRRTARKIPAFLANPHFRFPDPLSAEQASDERVASFHASLIRPGEKVLDMTAGLGIDAMTIARAGASVTAIELDESRAKALAENAQSLNLQAINTDSILWLQNSDEHFSTIFIDPARRDNIGRRTYGLADCEPNLLTHLSMIMAHTDRLIVKASPMLDITQLCRDLPGIAEVGAVSVAGECKEVYAIVTNTPSRLKIRAAVIAANGDLNEFYTEGADAQPVVYADSIEPGHFLYEPDSAIMKLSAWAELIAKFPTLKKAALNTHLFLSPVYYEKFPGRCVKITDLPSSKELKRFKRMPLNVVARNYPQRAEDLAKKLGVKSGQDNFIYAFRLGEKPVLALGQKLF